MKKNLLMMAAATMLLTISCMKEEPPQVGEYQHKAGIETKAVLDKTPKLTVYVETNDVNPLNAMDYKIGNGCLIDRVNVFAANIHKKTVNGVVEPVVYLNDKLTPILENGGADSYIWPLQQQSIKVILTLLGDWQHIGLANMTEDQQKMFVNELLYMRDIYGLDGFDFDDEYADYTSPAVNNTSYTGIISKLKEKDSSIMLSAFDWGNTNTLSTAAVGVLDYGYHGHFGSYVENYSIVCHLDGIAKAKWSPLSLNLANNYNTTWIKNKAAEAKTSNYGALMCFNLRTIAEHSPLPIFQAMSNGAWGGQEVTCTGGNRPRPAAVPGGFSIDHETAYNYLVANNLPHFF